MALLLVSRPAEATCGFAGETNVHALAPGLLRSAGVWAGAVALTCGLLVAAGSLFFGSVEAAVAKLRGEPITVTPSVDFGTVRHGEQAEQVVAVTNWTDGPVRLIGGSANCTCVATVDLPVTVPPGATAPIRIHLYAPRTGEGLLSQKVSLWTDNVDQPRIDFMIRCRLTE